MRRAVAAVLVLAVAGAAARADERPPLDAQRLRTAGAPGDLPGLAVSRPLGHLALATGALLSLAGGRPVDAATPVGRRLQLDVAALIGVYGWADLGVVLPVVLYQAPAPVAALGDLRLTAKVAIPGLRRRPERAGTGAAVALQLGFPTGSRGGFASDGQVTAQPSLVVDHRTGSGTLVVAGAGAWVRPERDSLVHAGIGVEAPLITALGLTLVASVVGHAPIARRPWRATDLSLELLLGARWYGPGGLVLTVGGGLGDGPFGFPSGRGFVSLNWVPGRRRAPVLLDRLPPGFVLPALPVPPPPPPPPPRVDLRGERIELAEPVRFATDGDALLPESLAIVDEIAAVLREHPEIERLRVEVHTDVRASAAYNLHLSQRRADELVRVLAARGVAPERLVARGLGRSRPLVPGATSVEDVARNRRVELHVERRRAP